MAEIFGRDANLVALMEKTGYNIAQENGQRKYGPPPNWLGPPPPKGCEIFIGKLPRDVFEDELVPLCEQFGMIYELRLMMDYDSNNRGYAFVTYTNIKDALKAIKELDDFEIRRGRHIGVCKSIDNCRLFIGGIPKEKSKEEIEKEVSKYTEGVSKVILYSSILDKTKNRGFAFVEYDSHRAAAMARRKLLNNSIKFFDHEIAVDWAQPETQVEDETMKRVTVLYVRNLSAQTNEDVLRNMFSMGGALKVERVKKMRDFAFIHYYKREEAEAALQQFDGVTVDGCTLEVTWAKPPDSQKQKTEKRDFGSYLYKQFNFPILPRSSTSLSRFQMHNMQNLRNPFTITRPIQLLGYICLENSWGEPTFQVSRIDSDCEVIYVAWVTIPGLPPQNRRFMCDKVCRSPEEAKHYAACTVLKKLGITGECQDFPFIPSALSLPSSYTNFPKNYPSSTTTMNGSKSGSNLIFNSPSKNDLFNFKSPIQAPNSCFFERGQGDAGSFNSAPSPDFSFDDVENFTPLLDPNTPIEPNSILGLLASVAAATNVDLPIFNNKPKL